MIRRSTSFPDCSTLNPQARPAKRYVCGHYGEYRVRSTSDDPAATRPIGRGTWDSTPGQTWIGPAHLGTEHTVYRLDTARSLHGGKIQNTPAIRGFGVCSGYCYRNLKYNSPRRIDFPFAGGPTMSNVPTVCNGRFTGFQRHSVHRFRRIASRCGCALASRRLPAPRAPRRAPRCVPDCADRTKGGICAGRAADVLGNIYSRDGGLAPRWDHESKQCDPVCTRQPASAELVHSV